MGRGRGKRLARERKQNSSALACALRICRVIRFLALFYPYRRVEMAVSGFAKIFVVYCQLQRGRRLTPALVPTRRMLWSPGGQESLLRAQARSQVRTGRMLWSPGGQESVLPAQASHW
ncbi:unnamed protein product [Ixodes persulcatus]